MTDYRQIIHRTFDDSYVITKNGMPYHVYPYAAEFAEEWDEVFAYAEAHFSYDTFDQQNFADTANVCLMKQSGMPGLPESVTWNAYTVPGGELERLTFDASGFLALYAGGAMNHKNETMQRGGERKAAVEAATTPEEVEAA